MKLVKLVILIFWLIVISFSAIAVTSDKSCEIDVKYYYKTGANEVVVYQLLAKSKEDCLKKSKLYAENSTPQLVSKKEVSIKWHGN